LASQTTKDMPNPVEILTAEGYSSTPYPKVFAKDDFESIAYSDGDEVEQQLLLTLKRVSDVSVLSPELQVECRDWTSTYHFSHNRANLLRPFEDSLKGKVLELGAGCGGVTRYLGETAHQVVAVEGSIRRCEINSERVRDLTNVSIVASELSEFRSSFKFDTVVVVGVLEYAALFIDSVNPHLDFLLHAKSFLRPGGVLLLAIENKLGLKYLAGAPEDHLGQPMVGVEGGYKDNGVSTFSYIELSELAKQAGFGDCYIHSPLPDYKITRALITAEGLQEPSFDSGELASQLAAQDPQLEKGTTFNLQKAWHEFGRAKLDGELANSFLLEARNGRSDHSELYGSFGFWYGLDRKPQMLKEKRFVSSEDGLEILVHEKQLLPQKTPTPYLSRFSQLLIPSSMYLVGARYSDRLKKLVSRENWQIEALVTELKLYFEKCGKWAKENQIKWPEDNHVLGEVDPLLVDLIPQNVRILGPNKIGVFDQEWLFSGSLHLYHILFRTLWTFNLERPWLGSESGVTYLQLIKKVFSEFGLQEEHINDCIEMEAELQSTSGVRPVSSEKMRAMLENQIFSPATSFSLLQTLEAEKAQLEAEKAQLLGSKSWALTKPLRFVARLFGPTMRSR